MPIQPVVAPAVPTSASPEVRTDGDPRPDEAFAELLRGRRDPHLLPTVTLGQMVHALAGGSGAPAPVGVPLPTPAADAADAVGPVPVSAAPAVRDAWGAAAERPTIAATGRGAQVLDAGERYLGVPYKWGGTSASTGFDCSGFVQQVFADVGVRLPRVSIDQSRQGSPVSSLAEARPGDLLFWRGSGSRPNHIGIYAGEGRMLVAPRTGDVVRYQEVKRTPDSIRRVA